MANSGASSTEPQLPRTHLGALGAAVGLTFGIGLFLLTALHVMLRLQGLPLGLLSQYFYGYDITWSGAMAGLAWGGAVGCVAGWLLGLVHNVTVKAWVLIIRARYEPSQASDLLDQI